MTPIALLKERIRWAEAKKKQLEAEIEGLEKEKESKLEEFKEAGLRIVEYKAAIRKLEEK